MSAIMRREIKNFLKSPLFWIGVFLVILGVFRNVRPYLEISYVSSDKDISLNTPSTIADADITDGYVPAREEDRRKLWEEEICRDLVSAFEMGQEEAEAVIEEMKGMDIQEACEYLKTKYRFYKAIYAYEATEMQQGTAEEINSYIRDKLEAHRFSYYFSRKFADFSGLFMGFFAAVMLAALFWQDTRKSTYELLHTKPVRAGQYVPGKAAGGFFVCLIVLAILNLVFWAACCIFTKGSGFEVSLMDFLAATGIYILPNMMMIVSVYGLISLLFRNPLPAVPLLILYMVYSNAGSENAEGVYGYYGRPLAIMVRFPGRFFDTVAPPMALLNQSFLILAAAGMILICMQLWKRRRM